MLRKLVVLAVLWIACFGLCYADPASVHSEAPPGHTSSLVSRNSAMALKVQSYDASVENADRIALENGGELLDSKTFVNPKGRKHGWIRMRVSSDQLDALRTKLLPLGTLYSESVDAEDQQPEFDSDTRRVSQLEIHQDRLGSVLNGVRRLRGSDILYIQDRLFRAGTDEQDLLQEQDNMRLRAGRSLVFVELFEPNSLPPAPHRTVALKQRFDSSMSLARSGFTEELGRICTATAYALTFAPIWGTGILVLLGVVLGDEEAIEQSRKCFLIPIAIGIFRPEPGVLPRGFVPLMAEARSSAIGPRKA